MLRLLSWVAAVVSATSSSPTAGGYYHRPQPARPIEPRAPLQPCFSVFKLANDTPPTEFRYTAGSARSGYDRQYYGEAGWWGSDANADAIECVFVLEAPARYRLSLQLHDVNIPQDQSGAAGNCISGPAVRVYNYTLLGELILAAELCQSTARGPVLALPTNAAVVATTLNTGRFDLLVSVAAPAAAISAPATAARPSAPAAPAAAAVVVAEGSYDDYEQGGEETETPVAPTAGVYDEADDLNLVDGDPPLAEDEPRQERSPSKAG